MLRCLSLFIYSERTKHIDQHYCQCLSVIQKANFVQPDVQSALEIDKTKHTMLNKNNRM